MAAGDWSRSDRITLTSMVPRNEARLKTVSGIVSDISAQRRRMGFSTVTEVRLFAPTGPKNRTSRNKLQTGWSPTVAQTTLGRPKAC